MIRWRADQSRAAGSCNDLRKRRPIALSSTTHTGASGTTCLRRRPAGTSFSRHGRHVNPRRPVPHRATAGTPGLLAVIRLAASPGVESSSRPRAACVAVPRAESPKSSHALRGDRGAPSWCTAVTPPRTRRGGGDVYGPGVAGLRRDGPPDGLTADSRLEATRPIRVSGSQPFLRKRPRRPRSATRRSCPANAARRRGFDGLVIGVAQRAYSQRTSGGK
jgi:hypothetical protein